ncbi:MAG TPA: hypothetical protein VN231_08930 [Allosphingosinicella sp.]|nr:hypothetical protein [Allosphingosinicella sp.]
MNRYYVAAGALLLSTSTFALAADTKPIDENRVEAVKVATDAIVATDAKVATGSKSFEAGWDGSLAATKPDIAAGSETKAELASFDGGFDKPAWADTEGKLQTASLDAEPKLQSASLETDSKFGTAGLESDSKVETASLDSFDKAETAHTGMGGPLETDSATTASLTPQPATQNYPPCDPGPGDDRCIQLYEEGVRTQLASWNRPTGGLLDDSSATAMGGPYEPVAHGSAEAIDSAQGGPFEPVGNDAAEIAMNGDGAIDAAEGETLDSEMAASGAAAAESEVAQHSEFTGVGGPVEAQSGYPPCSPGPGDDRCIQLYEQGISGAGN